MAYNAFEWRERVKKFRSDTRKGLYGVSGSPGAPEFPTIKPYPESSGYDTPGYDRRRVNYLAQQYADPQIQKLERAVQGAGAGYYKNPLERKLAIRGAMEGYGGAMSNIMAGARKAGAATYAPEYAEAVYAAKREADEKLNKKIMDWQGDRERAIAEYEAELSTYTTDMEKQYAMEAIEKARMAGSDARWRARVSEPFRPARPINRGAWPWSSSGGSRSWKGHPDKRGRDWAESGGMSWAANAGEQPEEPGTINRAGSYYNRALRRWVYEDEVAPDGRPVTPTTGGAQPGQESNWLDEYNKANRLGKYAA